MDGSRIKRRTYATLTILADGVVEPAELRSVAGSLVQDSVLHSRPVFTFPPGGTHRSRCANEVISLLTSDACQSGSVTGS